MSEWNEALETAAKCAEERIFPSVSHREIWDIGSIIAEEIAAVIRSMKRPPIKGERNPWSR